VPNRAMACPKWLPAQACWGACTDNEDGRRLLAGRTETGLGLDAAPAWKTWVEGYVEPISRRARRVRWGSARCFDLALTAALRLRPHIDFTNYLRHMERGLPELRAGRHGSKRHGPHFTTPKPRPKLHSIIARSAGRRLDRRPNVGASVCRWRRGGRHCPESLTPTYRKSWASRWSLRTSAARAA
jgi:hypothetical protein